MIKEQQRIAIAELCGWKRPDHPDVMKLKVGWRMPEKRWMDPRGVLQLGEHALPDYLSDLNAMHEAEKILDDAIMDAGSKRYVYAGFLYLVCGKEQQPCRATSEQRAEAFLRTMGKWVEGNE